MKKWNDMPPEIKCMIVGNMDFETRERLKMCSQADKTIIESTALKIEKLEVEKYKTREEVEQVRIKLTVDGKQLKIFANDCKVEFRWNDNEKSIEFENKEEAFAWMEEYYAKYLLNDKMKIQYFSTDLNIPDIIANHESKLKMISVRINVERAAETLNWLEVIDSGLEELIIEKSTNENTDVLEGIGSHPLVMNAKKFEITRNNDMNDEQLLNLKCKNFHISSHSDHSARINWKIRITVHGIRRLIEKVIAGDYPIGSTWSMLVDFDLDTILAGFSNDTITRSAESYNAFLPINEEKKLEVERFVGHITIRVVSHEFELNEEMTDEEEDEEEEERRRMEEMEEMILEEHTLARNFGYYSDYSYGFFDDFY